MFILKVTNKQSGQVEQSDFQTELEAVNHKSLLEALGYQFEDKVNDLNEPIPATHSFEIIEDVKSEKLKKIAELEAKITPRRIRDALLGDKSFIEQVEAEIAEIRKSL
jgi:hypothetical protein